MSTMRTEQKKSQSPRNVSHAQGQGQPAGMVCDHPVSSVLVVFGVGIWAGVALGRLLVGPPEPLTLGRRTELAAEQLGQQMLNAIAGVLPTSISKHISV